MPPSRTANPPWHRGDTVGRRRHGRQHIGDHVHHHHYRQRLRPAAPRDHNHHGDASFQRDGADRTTGPHRPRRNGACPAAHPHRRGAEGQARRPGLGERTGGSPTISPPSTSRLAAPRPSPSTTRSPGTPPTAGSAGYGSRAPSPPTGSRASAAAPRTAGGRRAYSTTGSCGLLPRLAGGRWPGRLAFADRGDRAGWPVRLTARRRVVPSFRSAFAGFRFPPEVITVAVRWYLRFGLSYRDVEELLAERGVQVDHVTVYR